MAEVRKHKDIKIAMFFISIFHIDLGLIYCALARTCFPFQALTYYGVSPTKRALNLQVAYARNALRKKLTGIIS